MSNYVKCTIVAFVCFLTNIPMFVCFLTNIPIDSECDEPKISVEVIPGGLSFGDGTTASDEQLLTASEPLRKLFPRSGWCGRCGIPWKATIYHDTKYTHKDHRQPPEVSDKHACFPMCQKCWESKRPIDRLVYYQRLFDTWNEDAKKYKTEPPAREHWEAIRSAVLAGE